MEGVKRTKEHSLKLDKREKLVLCGIINVGTFDEKEILLESTMGAMALKGEGLHITQLNLDDQTLAVEGLLKSIVYTDGETKGSKAKGLLTRILR